MKRLIHGLVATGAMAIAASVSAYAQDAIARLVGRPIVTVRFDIEGRSVTSPDLEKLVPIKAGDPQGSCSLGVRLPPTHVLCSAADRDDATCRATPRQRGLRTLLEKANPAKAGDAKPQGLRRMRVRHGSRFPN